MSQNEKTEIDLKTVAPTIIDDVARTLMPDRPIFYETESEIRLGNRGSFSVNKHRGTFQDYETATGGGLLDMIVHLCNFEHRSQAFNWLKEKGFIDGTFTPTQRPRPIARNTTHTHSNRDMFKEGQKLWSEATPIPFYQRHPVRRWCTHRNLFPGYKELPPTIRWHEGRGYIIVALASLQDFINVHPEPPAPRQFHLIAITSDGQKRYVFKGGSDKRTWGRPDITCVSCFGDPMAEQINICEGIADALSIFARSPGATLASITTFQKIKNCEQLITCLTAKGRSVALFSDNDDAGRKAQTDLARALYQRGGDVFVHENPTAKDPAAAAELEGKDE